jgi:hypothetical protein
MPAARVKAPSPALRDLAAELLALERELAGLNAEPESWSPESFAGQHEPQLSFLRDTSQWQHVMCARQAGKTWGACGKLLGNAITRRQTVNVFLGLTGAAVRENVWEVAMKPLCARYGISGHSLNETRMSVHLDNGSRVLMGGTSDYEHIKKQLGKRLDGGVFVIDEAQGQRDTVLTPLLDSTLPPMLTPTTQVILTGVLPDVPAGRFYRERDRPRWSKHGWGRFANVHTPEAREQFEAYLATTGISIEDPRIQRDWFGRAVFDSTARAFRYDPSKNSYQPGALILPNLTSFAVGIDPGAYDRTAIVVVGWGEGTGLWVVEEVVTPLDSGTTWAWIGRELGRIQVAYRPSWYFADFGGSKMNLDVFGRDHGVWLVAAAKKGDRRGQVDRVNGLFTEGMCHVPEGSDLEGDLLKTQWDPIARDKGDYEWSSHNHPDVADAFRYAAHAYFEHRAKEPEVRSNIPSVAARIKALKEREEGKSYFEQRRSNMG